MRKRGILVLGIMLIVIISVIIFRNPGDINPPLVEVAEIKEDINIDSNVGNFNELRLSDFVIINKTNP